MPSVCDPTYRKWLNSDENNLHVGTLVSAISLGGLLFVAPKKLDKYVALAVTFGLFGTAMAVFTACKLKLIESQKPAENQVFQLILPPEKSRWSWNKVNVARSFWRLAEDYRTFMEQNRDEDDMVGPNFRVEFAKDLMDSLVTITKNRFLPIRKSYPERLNLYREIDHELFAAMIAAKNEFELANICDGNVLVNETWFNFYYRVLKLLERWCVKSRDLII